MTAAGEAHAPDSSDSSSAEAYGHRADLLTRTGLGLAIIAKVADAGTTWVGVTVVPGVVEQNPIAAGVMRLLGPAPGLAALSAVALIVTVIAVKSIRRSVADLRIRGYRAARWLWIAPAAAYLGVAMVWGSAAVRNFILLVGTGTLG